MMLKKRINFFIIFCIIDVALQRAKAHNSYTRCPTSGLLGCFRPMLGSRQRAATHEPYDIYVSSLFIANITTLLRISIAACCDCLRFVAVFLVHFSQTTIIFVFLNVVFLMQSVVFLNRENYEIVQNHRKYKSMYSKSQHRITITNL